MLINNLINKFKLRKLFIIIVCIFNIHLIIVFSLYKKKFIFIVSVFLVLILNSCIKVENKQQLRIVHKCKNLLCSFELTRADLQVTTDIIGRQSIRVVKEEALRNDVQSDLRWTIIGGTIASNDDMNRVGLPQCGSEDPDCSDRTNPTSGSMEEGKEHRASVSGTYRDPETGEKIPIQDSSATDIVIDDITNDTPLDTITLHLPASSKTAEEIASEFKDYSTSHISQVVGDNASNTLTFTCEPNYHFDPLAVNLGVGQVQTIGNWKYVRPELPTSLWTGEVWKKFNIVAAANNSDQKTTPGTGISCGVLINK